MDLSRRQLIASGGLIGGAGLAAALWTGRFRTASPDDDPPGPSHDLDVPAPSEFATVVDAVSVGADPTGREPINRILEQYVDDDTLIIIPAGTYRLLPIELTGYRRFGLAAEPGAHPTFVGDPAHCVPGGESYLRFHEVGGLLFDGIDIDFTAPGAGGTVRINAVGDVVLGDVDITGSCDEQITQLRLDVLDPDATALVERLTLDMPDDETDLTAIFVGEPHAGTAVFRDCTVSGFTDNGLYGSPPGLPTGAGGTVRVERGVYRNNNIANIRLGTEGSVADGVESVSDAPPPVSGGSPANARGIRLRNGQRQLIENCRIQLTSTSRFAHAGITVHETNGGATVRNTEVEVDRDDTPAVRLFPDQNTHAAIPEFDGVTVTGSAAGGQAIFIDDRDETVFRNCTLRQSGANRNGIFLRDSADCRLVNCHIEVTNRPLVLQNSTLLIQNSTLINPQSTETISELLATEESLPRW